MKTTTKVAKCCWLLKGSKSGEKLLVFLEKGGKREWRKMEIKKVFRSIVYLVIVIKNS